MVGPNGLEPSTSSVSRSSLAVIERHSTALAAPFGVVGNWLWSLGRFGLRIAFYGSLNCVIPAETAADWITALLDMRELTNETASAVVQLGRRVDDRTRDISQDVVRSVIAGLKSAGVADDTFLRPLQEYIAPARADVVRTFGEPLPKGLELEITANCLSPVTALTS
jgi:hypothetical protein